VQRNAHVPMTVFRINPNKGCIFRKTISIPSMKDMVGVEVGQHLTRRN
jgi:hypothetical protein